MKGKIIVGSRESKLAVAQSMTLVDHLTQACPAAEIALVTMKTTGDKILDKTLDKIGGKGLFVKELELALRDRRVDLTVHSLKDLPMELPEDLPLLGCSRREDPRDVLVLPPGVTEPPKDLPIGTASFRRALQLRALYPAHRVEPVRGNVYTRLRKLDEGQYGALVLAAAGLKRLGLESRIARYFSPEEMIPAAGQGILGIQGRRGEDHSCLEGYTDQDAAWAALCERAFVAELDGGCSSPVCAYARVTGEQIHLRGLYYDEGTGGCRVGARAGDKTLARQLGIQLAQALRENREGEQ